MLEWLVNTGKVEKVLKADGRLKTTEALENAATPEMWDNFQSRNLVWPAGTVKSWYWCCDQYGFPLLGKAASKLQARRINIDCFLRFSHTNSERPEMRTYYEMLRECRISQHCCTELKKKPSDKLCAELKIDCVFMGMMASESRRRLETFCDHGYLYTVKKNDGRTHYHCHPMGIWTDEDVWEYIRRYEVPYSPLYDMGYTDPRTGKFVKITRNGCLGCGTDLQFTPNHLSILRQTHPRIWRGLMRCGMGEQIKRLRRFRMGGQYSMLDYAPVEQVIDMNPCAFDQLDGVSFEGMSEFDTAAAFE